MKLYAFIFAVLVLRVHSASLKPSADKILDDPNNIELGNVEQKLKINDAVIPAAVVEEKDSAIIKKVELDLKNPGPPQRQEHETQTEEESIMYINEKIVQTRNIFNEKLNAVSENFENLIKTNENIPIVQQNINNLKDAFHKQFSALNSTVQSYIRPDTGNVKSDLKLDSVVDNLNSVKNNFDSSINILSQGVQQIAKTREDETVNAKDEASGSNSESNASVVDNNTQGNQVQNVFQSIYNAVSSSLQNLQNSVTNTNQNNIIQNPITVILNPFINQGQASSGESPTNVQSDDQGTQAPTFIQTIQNSWQSFFNAFQNNQVTPTNSPSTPVSNSDANNSENVKSGTEPIVQGLNTNKLKDAEKPKEDSEGHHGGNENNQGDNNNSDREDHKKEPAAQEANSKTKIEETATSSLTAKTE